MEASCTKMQFGEDAAKTGAVIMAAGMSSRMGDFKPLLEIGGMSFARRTIANFRQAGVSPVVVVTGYRAEDLEKHLAAGEGVLCLRNPEYASTEMVDSAAIGLEYLREKCSRTFFCPVDVPLFRASTLQKMMQASGDIVRPVCGRRSGHPVLLKDELIPDVLEKSMDSGLGAGLRAFAGRTDFVNVPDEGILLDADTPGEYEQLIAYHDRQLLRPEIDVRIARKEQILDARTALLLRIIAYDGTVKDACRRLCISYRKAWNMIGDAEAALGVSLVLRSPGGEYGGGSCLTPEGERLLACYETFVSRVNAFARNCFEEVFSEWTDRS